MELKRCLLKAVLKVAKVPESYMEAGILLQVAGEDTANECLWKSGEA